MNKDKLKGAAKETKGKVKRKTGKMTGDERTETKGVVEEAAGKAQRKFGEAKDKLRD